MTSPYENIKMVVLKVRFDCFKNRKLFYDSTRQFSPTARLDWVCAAGKVTNTAVASLKMFLS